MLDKEEKQKQEYNFLLKTLKNKDLYNTISAQLGRYINEQREKKGISYRKLAKATGISPTVLADTENGNKIPRFETLIRIVCVLDIPLENIFGEILLPPEKFHLDCSYRNNKKNVKDNLEINIPKLLVDEGLSKNDVKEIMNYIKYKIDASKKK